MSERRRAKTPQVCSTSFLLSGRENLLFSSLKKPDWDCRFVNFFRRLVRGNRELEMRVLGGSKSRYRYGCWGETRKRFTQDEEVFPFQSRCGCKINSGSTTGMQGLRTMNDHRLDVVNFFLEAIYLKRNYGLGKFIHFAISKVFDFLVSILFDSF